MTMTELEPKEKTSGWIYVPPIEHTCALPNKVDLDKQLKGAIWCCGDCQQYWTVTWVEPRGMVGYKMLRRISPARATEIIRNS